MQGLITRQCDPVKKEVRGRERSCLIHLSYNRSQLKYHTLNGTCQNSTNWEQSMNSSFQIQIGSHVVLTEHLSISLCPFSCWILTVISILRMSSSPLIFYLNGSPCLVLKLFFATFAIICISQFQALPTPRQIFKYCQIPAPWANLSVKSQRAGLPCILINFRLFIILKPQSLITHRIFTNS